MVVSLSLKVKRRNVAGEVVSHLFFTNDTLIFCDESKENLEYFNWVFMWFEVCSSFKINLEKSELIPVGEVPNLEELAKVLGCKVGSLPSTYLSLPLVFLTSLVRYGKEWRNGSKKGLLCGRDNIFQKVEHKR